MLTCADVCRWNFGTAVVTWREWSSGSRRAEGDLTATETEFITMLTQSQSQELEARSCDEQALDQHVIYAQKSSDGT